MAKRSTPLPPKESVTVSMYAANASDAEIPLAKASAKKLNDDQLLWIDLARPSSDTIAKLQTILSVQQDAITRILDAQRPIFLDNYGDYFSLTILLVPKRNQQPVRFSCVLGRNWLLTISHDASPHFVSAFRGQDKGETMIGQLTAGELLVALLDWHLADFFEEVSEIEARVDKLDEKILKEAGQDVVLRELVAIRRLISTLRRTLADQRSVFYALNRADILSAMPDEATASLSRLSDKFERAIDEVERTRDLLVGSFELFTSLSAETTNRLVKSLTFVTVVIGVLGAMAGIFGMNFELPIFKNGTFGFLVVVGLMAVSSGASLWFARHRDWI